MKMLYRSSVFNQQNSFFSTYLAIIFCISLIIPATALQAQMAIGDSLKEPHPSAVFEIFSETKGFLPPRLTTEQRDSIDNPAEGLVVFDTDLNQLLYYSNGWKDFGLWSRDSIGNLYYTPARVALGPGSDTLVLDATSPTLNINGVRGIVTYTIPDTAYAAVNSFTAELEYGGATGNTLVHTIQSNNPEGSTAGLTSYLESDARTSIAALGQVLYTGPSGDFGDLEAFPYAIGMASRVSVLDTNAVLLAVGSDNIVNSDHLGINAGVNTTVYSDSTYGNIGLLTGVNVNSPLGILDSFVFQQFPNRFTSGVFTYNEYADSNDFNIYAAGVSKSYFGGNVGIGTSEPIEKLHVAGNIFSTDTILADKLKLSTDACNGCILKSDGTGLASWVDPDSLTSATSCLWVSAGAMIPQSSDGAKSITEQSASTKTMTDYFVFDTTDYVQFNFSSKKKTIGSVNIQIYWDVKAGASAGDSIRWGISAKAVSDDDAIDASWGTEAVVTDVVSAVGDLHITSSITVTIGNSPAVGDMIWFRLRRKAGGTYVPEGAKLAAVSITY